MTTDLEGIVLKVEDNKEKDGLVSIMTKDKVFKVRARGIMNSTSKLRSCCQPFSLVSWTISTKNKGFPLLLHGTCQTFYYHIQENLLLQAISFVLRDLILRSETNENLYYYTLAYFKSAQVQDTKIYMWACLILKEILLIEGIQPNTDHCVNCLRKDEIEVLDLHQGGFLCHHCNHSHQKNTKEELIKIYSLFHIKNDDVQKFSSLFDFELKDVLYWISWYEYHDQFRLKSFRFLKQIINNSKISDT